MRVLSMLWSAPYHDLSVLLYGRVDFVAVHLSRVVTGACDHQPHRFSEPRSCVSLVVRGGQTDAGPVVPVPLKGCVSLARGMATFPARWRSLATPT